MTRLVPMLLITVGVALMAFQITTESEPGAIPLALIGLGIGVHLITRARRRRDRNQPL